MTPKQMADIHRRAMIIPPAWGVPTFAGFLGFPGAVYAAEPGGFALGRVMADEAEILTIAVVPEARRRGIAGRCLEALETKMAAKGAARIFLEVAQTNDAARALYARHGYEEVGQRPDYYATPDGTKIDAILMAKSLKAA